MRAVVQRVSEATVTVEGTVHAEIGVGLLVLLGVETGDQPGDARYVAEKVAGLRVFNDPADRMNLSLADVHGSCLIVSQFTLLADTRRGRRPGFSDAAPPEAADRLYREVCRMIADRGIPVATGVFRATMRVALVNDGPVTLLIDSRKRF